MEAAHAEAAMPSLPSHACKILLGTGRLERVVRLWRAHGSISAIEHRSSCCGRRARPGARRCKVPRVRCRTVRRARPSLPRSSSAWGRLITASASTSPSMFSWARQRTDAWRPIAASTCARLLWRAGSFTVWRRVCSRRAPPSPSPRSLRTRRALSPCSSWCTRRAGRTRRSVRASGRPTTCPRSPAWTTCAPSSRATPRSSAQASSAASCATRRIALPRRARRSRRSF